MANKIDVLELAKKIEKYQVPETRKEIEELISSINGQSMSAGEIIEKIVGPLVGIVSTSNRIFTIELLQNVVDELQKDE